MISLYENIIFSFRIFPSPRTTRAQFKHACARDSMFPLCWSVLHSMLVPRMDFGWRARSWKAAKSTSPKTNCHARSWMAGHITSRLFGETNRTIDLQGSTNCAEHEHCRTWYMYYDHSPCMYYDHSTVRVLLTVIIVHVCANSHSKFIYYDYSACM